MSIDRELRIALLYDGVSDAVGAAPDLAIGGTLDAVERVLTDAGHQVKRVAAAGDGSWIARIATVDLVFNLCEGLGGDATAEARVIAALELLAVPFTGAGSWTAALCLRKPVVNALLAAEGIAVPAFATARSRSELATAGDRVGFPCVIKPAAEDASIGVTQASVVRDAAALDARGAEMLARWDELVVQRYVAGRELNVGVLCGRVLPPSEISFAAMPAGLWPIVSYESKWSEGSTEDLGAAPRCPADVGAALGAQLERAALAAWRCVGGEGYGRVDFRVDADGRPWVLEVNANPDFAPDAGLARMAAAAGLSYAALVWSVARGALERASAVRATDGADGALLASGVH